MANKSHDVKVYRTLVKAAVSHAIALSTTYTFVGAMQAHHISDFEDAIFLLGLPFFWFIAWSPSY